MRFLLADPWDRRTTEALYCGESNWTALTLEAGKGEELSGREEERSCLVDLHGNRRYVRC